MNNLFFDLDGTLTHSHDGIIRCINHALMDAGLPSRSDAELRPFLGPPLRESFATLLETSDPVQVERAMSAYRARFEAVGMFENTVCPGILDALDALASAGLHLHVVTAKPAIYARRILEHFTLAGFFEGVFGPELASRGYTKTSLIKDALKATGVAAPSTAMIGDRGEDVIGARTNGVYSVAVSWGYGDPDELEAAAPDCVVHSPAELVSRWAVQPRGW